MSTEKAPALILYFNDQDFAMAYPNQSYCQRCKKQVSSLTSCPACKKADQMQQAFKLTWTQNPGMIVQRCIESPEAPMCHDHLGRPWTGKMLCNFLGQCQEQEYDIQAVKVH